MGDSISFETRAGAAEAGQGPDMLNAFASVGARRFDLTFTDLAGDKISFRPDRSLDQLRPSLETLLAEASARQRNVIVRPRAAGAALIQLDDLDEATIERLLSVAFLAVRTSPGNYQAWIAVAGQVDNAFVRRLRQGTGADPGASGATRLSGSWNFKEKFAPAFPRIETVHASPGRIVTPAELEALGIVAPAPPEPPPPARASPPRANRGWPSYQRCLQNAPPARSGDRPDVSRADFTFCLLAIDWGWGIEETAARLMEESNKAREEGERYALRTTQNAAAAVERRGPRRC